MDIRQQVGETAGKVWHLLQEGGPQTYSQLRKKLKGADHVLAFALGWLAREEKIEILPEKQDLRIRPR